MTKIALGTPMYDGGCKSEFVFSLVKWLQKCSAQNIEVTPLFIKNESLIQRARNEIAAEFLRGDCEALMFIDADIGFGDDFVKKLVDSGQDIIGGLYPTKTMDYAKIDANSKHPVHCAGTRFAGTLFPSTKQTALTGPFEVARIGTGFMYITRKAFETIIAVNPPVKHISHSPFTQTTDKIYTFFDCGTNQDGVYLSEDYYFCDLARSCGLKIMADPKLFFSHTGSFAYTSCFSCSNGVKIHAI